MAPKKNTAVSNCAENKKRKDPPQSSNSQKATSRGRAIVTQKSDAALSNGEVDLQSFLKSREFEIKELHDGIARAFQQAPRDLQRRTASHNVKRVPKRMQRRAAREMKDDNTLTIMPNKRKPGSLGGRIRAETAKRLGILAEKKRAQKAKSSIGDIDARAPRPKIRRDKLNDPPKPKSKFRKRQIHKT